MKRLLLASLVGLGLFGCQAKDTSLKSAPPLTPSTPQTAPPDTQGGGTTPSVNLNYLSPQSVDLAVALAPLTTDLSLLQADLDRVLQLQDYRSDDQCDRARTEIDESLVNFFGGPYGTLSTLQIKNLQKFFDKIQNDVLYIQSVAQEVYFRSRPFIADPHEVIPCSNFKLPTTTSYPSSHSLHAYVMALVLMQIDPAHQTIYWKRAGQIAKDRVIAGVHYPSDIRAGRRLAQYVFEALLKNPKFQVDLQAIIKNF